MGKLIIKDLGDEEKEIDVPDGANIQSFCEDVGVPFGCEEGLCGTCLMQVEEGMNCLSEWTQEEKDFFGEEGCERLACQCKLMGGKAKVNFS